MQTAINPALAAAMTLEQAAQVGEFSPVTKDGNATVVGRNLQQALQPMMPQGIPQGMPGMQPSMPGVRNAAQQAGLGGQIQAMQMQEAQKAIMNAAMQQAKPPAGIERLNPQMGNFAEGGIVGRIPGYATAGVAEEDVQSIISPEEVGSSGIRTISEGDIRLRVPSPKGERVMTPPQMRQEGYPEQYIQSRLRSEYAGMEIIPASISAPAASAPPPQAPPPQVPPPIDRRPPPMVQTAQAAPSVMSQGIASAMGERARKEAESLKGMATPEEVLAYEQRKKAVFDQFLRNQGINPDAFTQREQEDKALMEQQRALLRERMEREQGRDTFLSRAGAALRGFRQMKGQGIGDAVASAHDNLARQLQSGEIRMDQFRDMEIRLNELEITRRRALDDARRSTAEGRWNDAQRELATERAAANEIKKIQISTYMPQAQAQIEEKKVEEMAASRREQRAQAGESKIASQLRDNLELMRKIESDIQNKYKTDKSIMAYEVLRMSGQPVPEPVAVAYEKKQEQIRDEIAARTGNVRAEVRRLQTQLYGRPLEEAAGAAPSAPPPGAVKKIGS